jgi:hypothetical protein
MTGVISIMKAFMVGSDCVDYIAAPFLAMFEPQTKLSEGEYFDG